MANTHNHGGHDHTAAPMVDEISDFEVLELAVRVVIEKGLFTAEDHRAFSEWRDARSPAAGSRMAAKAWTDPAYESRVFDDPLAASKDVGVDWSEPSEFGTTSDDMHLTVLEDTPEVHQVIGLPPQKWSFLKYGNVPFGKDTQMPRKRHTAEEIVAKLRQVDVLTSQGKTVAEAVRTTAVTEVSYYRWRKEYGGRKGDKVRRLIELEAENARLRRAVADLTLDKMVLAEAARGKSPRPTARYRRRQNASTS